MKTLLRGKVRWLLIVWIFPDRRHHLPGPREHFHQGRFIEQEFHLTHIQLGWVFSAFILGYALFQAPGGRLADRYGPARVIAIVILWYALFTSAHRLDALHHPLRLGASAVRALSAGHRRSLCLPFVQPPGRRLDSQPGTRLGQRHHLRRRGRRRGHRSAHHQLHHQSLRLALDVLDHRHDRHRRRRGLVPDCPRPARGPSLDESRRSSPTSAPASPSPRPPAPAPYPGAPSSAAKKCWPSPAATSASAMSRISSSRGSSLTCARFAAST